ncbi:MAG: hypothetical protein WCQ99_09440 [Pseudomonadota bacterium]
MKIVKPVCVVLILFACSYSVFAAPGWCAEEQKDTAKGAESAPKIQFNELSYDFGKSSQNIELKHSFIFKNSGKGLLLIDKVKAG